jgi:hypothetical protein
LSALPKTHSSFRFLKTSFSPSTASARSLSTEALVHNRQARFRKPDHTRQGGRVETRKNVKQPPTYHSSMGLVLPNLRALRERPVNLVYANVCAKRKLARWNVCAR